MEKRQEFYVHLAAIAVLVAGCLLVLRPFVTAMLFSAVVCVSTWPMYLWLLRVLHGRHTPAALVMTLSLILVVILPLALVAYNLADNVTAFYDTARQSIEAGPPAPPAWLKSLPLLGAPAEEYWISIAGSQEKMLTLTKRLLEPTKDILLAGGMLLGVTTFLLSVVPIGPPLIWGGAAIWLYQQGETGWAIFMLLWGGFLISGIDNIIKPLLIGRGSSMPFLLAMLGVLGGVLAFGFVGIFIGPTLLAVGFNLLQQWTSLAKRSGGVWMPQERTG